jgi:cell filamentation protein
MKPKDRYDASALIEDQCEPGSRGRVLRNLLGIRSKREMDRVERIALADAMEQFTRTFERERRFRSDDIRQIHATWLGDIYPWAGRYRQVNLSKGGFPFAAAAQVPRLMAELEEGPLATYTPCVGRSVDKIAEALAVVHAELVLIHPFREGNGRTARMLANLMALQAGYPLLDFRGIGGKGNASYVAAIHACLGRDYGPLTAIFARILARSRLPRSGD